MTTLIILGNINQYTFVNSIIIANEKSKNIFNGKKLDKIHVFHTEESFQKLLVNLDNEN